MKKIFVLTIIASSMGVAFAAQPNGQNGTSSTTSSTRYYEGSSQTQYNTQGQPQGQYNYQGQYGTSYSQGTNGGQINDQSLNQQIQNMLNTDKYKNVTASVNNGTVTLLGSVKTREDRDSLGSAIGGINGVKGVNNKVTVQEGNGSNYGSQSYGNGSSGYGNGTQNYNNNGSSPRSY